MDVLSVPALIGALVLAAVGSKIGFRGWVLLIIGLVGVFFMVYVPYRLHAPLTQLLMALLPHSMDDWLAHGMSYLLPGGAVVVGMAYVGHKLFQLVENLSPSAIEEKVHTESCEILQLADPTLSQ